jgi:hypothetical protein
MPHQARAALRLLAPLIILGLIFAGGILAGRAWFPRIQVQQVDPKIVGVAVPGETKIVPFAVPGPVQLVQVPVEVTRFIDRPGQDRIVTITKPVPVPVDVIRREWPQFITVAVGSVLTKEYGWATPVNPQLIIGQVAPGAYAVSSQMEGWKIDEVRTETKVATAALAPRWHVELRPTIGVLALGGNVALSYGATVQASRGHISVQIAGGQSTAGPWGLGFVSYRF